MANDWGNAGRGGCASAGLRQPAAGKRHTQALDAGAAERQGGCGAVTLSIEAGVALALAGGQGIQLVHVLTLNKHGLNADKDALLRMMEGDTQQPVSGVGSAAWLKQNARAAANARHSKPGGSRDKQDQIREAWASGKCTTRDICAEQEYAALEMSFSAAPKATPPHTAPIHDRRGEVTGAVMVFHDVSAVRAMTLKMSYMA